MDLTPRLVKCENLSRIFLPRAKLVERTTTPDVQGSAVKSVRLEVQLGGDLRLGGAAPAVLKGGGRRRRR